MISLAADPGPFHEVDVSLIEQAAGEVLTHEQVSTGRISIAFLNDQDIRAINLQYLQRDSVTDVISFALHAEDEHVVGDIYVGFEQAVRQSEECQVDLAEELVRLTVHGVLHVLGHDHPETDRESSPFFQQQEELVEAICARRGDDVG